MADIKNLGVVGAGPMGGRHCTSRPDCRTSRILYDLDSEALTKSREEILSRITRLVEKGKLPGGAEQNADARCCQSKIAGGVRG